jgi:hypothetical protein
MGRHEILHFWLSLRVFNELIAATIFQNKRQYTNLHENQDFYKMFYGVT